MVELSWQSAANYLAGQDLVEAVQAGVRALPGDDPRLARGHFSLAETYQAQGQRAKARAHWLKCIELAAPPYDDRARYRLARQELEAKDPAAAKEILAQLVQRAGPNLERELHENALYLLGNVLYELGEYDEAAVRLGEAVRRFPGHPEAVKTRDRLGEYYWQRKARAIAAEATEGGPEGRRPLAEAMRLKRREYLEEALKTYQELDRFLAERSRTRPPDLETEFIWCKARFGVGLVWIDLEDYAAALEHFRSLQQTYHGVLSLLAARNVHVCWDVLTRGDRDHPLHAEAIEVIRRARQELDEIPREREEDQFRSDPQHYGREQWRKHLVDWEAKLRHDTPRVNPNAFAPALTFAPGASATGDSATRRGASPVADTPGSPMH